MYLRGLECPRGFDGRKSRFDGFLNMLDLIGLSCYFCCMGFAKLHVRVLSGQHWSISPSKDCDFDEMPRHVPITNSIVTCVPKPEKAMYKNPCCVFPHLNSSDTHLPFGRR